MIPDVEQGSIGQNAFIPRVLEKLGFYVYLLVDPRDGAIFYIGKGTGNRCFAHIAEARLTRADTVGDYAKLARIRAIEASGARVRIDLLRHGLSEREAFLVESAAIDLLGLAGLVNRVAGHQASEVGRMSVSDANALYGAMPVTIAPEHRVMLIRINRRWQRGMSDDELYEAAREWWKVGPQARRLGTASAPERAMAVFGGVVRAVYRIEVWEPPSDDDLTGHPNRRSRWCFVGERDRSMEELYLHRDVSDHLRGTTGRSTQNPIRYVNCTGG